MRIALVISTLQTGGGERVAVRLAKGFAQARHAVTLVTLSEPESDFYAVPDGVERVALDLMRSATNTFDGARANVQRLTRLRAALRAAQPDVVIAFMPETNVRTLLALAGTGIPVIVTEHNDPGRDRVGDTWKRLRRCLYPRAARVVGVSQGVIAGFHWLSAPKRAVIYNPVDLEFDSVPPLPPGLPTPDASTIIAVGRLAPQKGFDLLLDAFAKTREGASGWRLMILGEGGERAGLERQAQRLGLGESVLLPGRVAEPAALLHRAAFLVLPSRYEGFGLVLIEALACGLPVIAFDCPSGPNEIVQPNVNGLLAPPEDVDALAAAMLKFMIDEELRRSLAQNGVSSAQRFTLSNVIAAWECLFAEMGLPLGGRRQT